MKIQTWVPEAGVVVSTVLLAVPHYRWQYETMIFDGKDGESTNWLERYGRRYKFLGAAKQGHAEIVAALKAGTLKLDDGRDDD